MPVGIIYSNNENLVRWARSETTGLAVIECHMGTGILECWNTGFGGMRSNFI
jgi:hypothetical protein